MGQYLNPGTDKFEMSLNSEIYVDKSNLIIETNKLFRTEKRFVCISRPRRFGKTMGVNMLATYYGYGIESHELFKNLKIASHPSYEKYLNKCDVVMINMQEFLSETSTVEAMIAMLTRRVGKEIIKINPTVEYDEPDSFIQVLMDTYLHTKRPFVILIDEWDCLFREYKEDTDSQKIYLDFLRHLLKDKAYIGLAYMTGILPIKKYGTHSALNMFDEYSMIRPKQFLNYFGFNEGEVKELARKYSVDMSEIERWYNGYFLKQRTPIYNPRSATCALESGIFDSYWNHTETFEALRDYIMLDYDGLREKVTLLLSGKSIVIDIRNFSNDMTSFDSADDVLTLLVHLGYLTYHGDSKSVRIPNEEVKQEFETSINNLKWENVTDAIKQSDKLLKALWAHDALAVAEGIGKVHEANTSILAYNDENALSCVISLALFAASEYYITHRELPSGKGYADLVFIPRKKHGDKPAIVVELKWDKSVEGATRQIKERNYISALDEYKGNVLLVGVNYDKASKVHECVIEAVGYGDTRHGR